MSGAVGPSDPSNSSRQSKPLPETSGSLARGMLFCGLAVSMAVIFYVAVQAVQERASLKAAEARLVAQHGLIESAERRIAPEYRDKNRDLIADAPVDAAQLIDPETLIVSHYEGDDDDDERVDWEGFRQRLSEATGKEVICQPYLNSADEVAAIKTGKIHVLALHAADTPYLVNHAGFVPVAVLGTGEGASGNHLVIATSPKSPVKNLADIRGRMLTCTRPDSITGYRAAITVLSHEAGLLPGIDYRSNFSFGQTRSIHGLVIGDYEVTALSADKIASMLAKGELKASDYRIIYESKIIPRLVIGHVYNLEPDLAAKVETFALEFDNAGADDSDAGHPMHFVPIDYRKDFAFVRRIDDSFDPRIVQVVNPTP